MSTSQAMPAKLIVVLILLCLSLALDLYNLTSDGGAINFLRIGLNLGLLVGLLRGQEWARSLAKITAVLGLIGGGLLLMQLLSLGGAAFAIPSLGYFAYAAVTLAIVYGVFVLWCMNQPDVVAWLGSRALRD